MSKGCWRERSWVSNHCWWWPVSMKSSVTLERAKQENRRESDLPICMWRQCFDDSIDSVCNLDDLSMWVRIAERKSASLESSLMVTGVCNLLVTYKELKREFYHRGETHWFSLNLNHWQGQYRIRAPFVFFSDFEYLWRKFPLTSLYTGRSNWVANPWVFSNMREAQRRYTQCWLYHLACQQWKRTAR